MALIHHLLSAIGLASLMLSGSYAALVILALSVWQAPRTAETAGHLPPVTILKPLCGAEPGLYDNLRSFCEQDYPSFQIVFGSRDPSDPALVVARQLLAEFPWLPIDIVVSPRLHGSNCKVSNLINMLPLARHEFLVMADSDALVRPDHLRVVTVPLSDPEVGLVTCIYHGLPTRLIWSRLGAMFVNEWYMPSVLLARLLGHDGYASGQTLALRRQTLDAIGGLREIANHLADDNRLGMLIRTLGLRIVLSHVVPSAEHHEPTLHSLTAHEVRWMCTLRVLRPLSFRFLFVTFSAPLAFLGLLLEAEESSLSMGIWALFGFNLLARLILHVSRSVRCGRPLLADVWLVPARDLLTCWVWLRSSFTYRVKWRDNDFAVGSDGLMRRLP